MIGVKNIVNGKTKPLDDRSQRGGVVGDIEPLRPIHYMKQIKMF